jgi:hypothetical protein
MGAAPVPQPDSVKWLGPLQGTILEFAYANREREHRGFNESRGADVYNSEILARVYGFPCESLWQIEDGEVTDQRRITGKKFDVRTIGRARYNRAQAAISRAIRRLEDRRLVVHMCGKYARWSGCSLTPARVAFCEAHLRIG